MKVKLTKIKGGKIPDGFWVTGDGDLPVINYMYFVRNVIGTSGAALTAVPMNWFQTKKIDKAIKTDFGYLLVGGDVLWSWRELP